MYRKTLVVTLMSLALGMSARAQNLIVNGGFESGTLGWTIGDPDGDQSTLIYNGNYLGAAPNTGSFFVWGGEINPEAQVPGETSHAGLVSQSGIETTAGVDYTISFWIRNLAYDGPVQNQLEVYWNNFGIGDGVLALVNIAATSDYLQYTVNVVGGDGPGTLTFEMSNPPTALLLDDVSMVATANSADTADAPEPGTWILLGSGLMLTGLRKYGRSGVKCLGAVMRPDSAE